MQRDNVAGKGGRNWGVGGAREGWAGGTGVGGRYGGDARGGRTWRFLTRNTGPGLVTHVGNAFVL